MSWGNVFLAGCFYLALPILYVVLRNNSKERNNLILAVTLTPEGRRAPEVEAVCQDFRRQLLWMFLILTVVMVGIACLPWVSIVTTLSCLWLIAAIVLPYYLFGKAHNTLKALKRPGAGTPPPRARPWWSCPRPNPCTGRPPRGSCHRCCSRLCR